MWRPPEDLEKEVVHPDTRQINVHGQSYGEFQIMLLSFLAR
jgi:hypothetical protein